MSTAAPQTARPASPPLSGMAAHAASIRQSAYSPAYMTAALAVSDLWMSTAGVVAGFALWRAVNPAISSLHPEMLLLPLCCVGVFAGTSQYPGIGLTAVQHLRRICRCVSMVYLLFLFGMFFTKGAWANSRGALLLAWVLTMAFVSCGRNLTMHAMARCPWWGVPVLVIGAGSTGRATVRTLNANRVLGYRPVAFLDDDPRKHGVCDGVPVVGTLDDAALIAREFGIGYAILAIPGMPRHRLAHLRRWRRIFPRILVISEMAGIASQWTEPRDLGGMIGFETRQNLLNPLAQWIKRALDLAASFFGLLVCAPVLGVCVLWIRKISPGNPFYVQEREGRDRTTLRILKLRTMFPNADEMLESHLARSSSAREEWERFCKLKRDPRILPGVGHFLRKTSLDELPQLWNVLKGEMTLVGPRPFPAYHNARFDPEFLQVRTQVRPGLTGLWQVSARSDGDLAVQQSLDSYYIRNWSLWLDIYILARTIRAVLAPRGSY
ncbi:MAG: exopolysaccharide biosynthesis polyprenyl glycosylphosphotransferase [Bryobacteraceae bacterium]|jgi:Undecaprenyl-phosphate galactose phosphotransferase WbaP